MAWFQIAIQLILNHRLALQAPNAPNIYLLNYHDCILTSKYCSWTNCRRGAVGYRFLFLFKLFVTLSINEDNFPPWDLENVPVNLIIIILFFQQIINLLSSFFFSFINEFFLFTLRYSSLYAQQRRQTWWLSGGRWIRRGLNDRQWWWRSDSSWCWANWSCSRKIKKYHIHGPAWRHRWISLRCGQCR